MKPAEQYARLERLILTGRREGLLPIELEDMLLEKMDYLWHQMSTFEHETAQRRTSYLGLPVEP